MDATASDIMEWWVRSVVHTFSMHGIAGTSSGKGKYVTATELS